LLKKGINRGDFTDPGQSVASIIWLHSLSGGSAHSGQPSEIKLRRLCLRSTVSAAPSVRNLLRLAASGLSSST